MLPEVWNLGPIASTFGVGAGSGIKFLTMIKLRPCGNTALFSHSSEAS